MAEHCGKCGGTGKVKLGESLDPVTCLHCQGTGIEPETKSEFKMVRFGPFHTYPKMKRDALIVASLVVLLLVINAIGG